MPVLGEINESLATTFPPDAVADPTIELLYIHHSAFGNLAATCEAAALSTSIGLAAMRAYRLVEHHLEEAVLLGAMPSNLVSAMLLSTVKTDREGYTVNGLFRRLGYKDKREDSDGGYVPLMDTGTRLWGTCMDDGYYTISFSEKGEAQMYADQVPFETLNADIVDGKGPSNLIVVHGTNVQGLDKLVAEGTWRPDLLARPYARLIPASRAKLERKLAANILTKDQVCAIETATRSAYAREILGSLAAYTYLVDRWEDVDPDIARSVLEDTMAALKKQLARPSFGHKDAVEGSNLPGDLLPVDELKRHIGPHPLAQRALGDIVTLDARQRRARDWYGLSRGHDAQLVGAV